MGIDTIAAEEPLEPPICGLRDPNQLPPNDLVPKQSPLLPHTADPSLSDLEKASILGGHKRAAVTHRAGTAGGGGLGGAGASGDYLAVARQAHTCHPDQVAALLQTDVKNGLSQQEAQSRLRLHGPNKIEAIKGVSKWKIFMRQITNSLTVVLFFVLALSFAIHDYIEGGVVTAVVLLNIVVGYIQDLKAEQTIAALYDLAPSRSVVIRDGTSVEVDADTLVVGDIVELRSSNVVPADVRLISGINLATDEAMLTGESQAAEKNADDLLSEADMPIGDRTNIAFSGCIVTSGRGRGIVIATGMHTEVGNIADLMGQQDKRARSPNDTGFARQLLDRAKATIKTILGLEGTPLQIRLSKFALLLFALAVVLAIIVFSASKWHVDGEVLIYGICVAVAVIPESLIAVLTITFAVATKAMAAGKVITRKLAALEAVGGVTNVCSDKTRTITQGHMIARTVWIPSFGRLDVKGATPFDPTAGTVDYSQWSHKDGVESAASLPRRLFTSVALCNTATVQSAEGDDSKSFTSSASSVNGASSDASWSAVGEPTEIALAVLALRFKCGKPSLLQDGMLHLFKEFPFDSSLKRMSVAYTDMMTNYTTVHSKGATEVMIPFLTSSDEEKREIERNAEKMADDGLRVICVAQKSFPASPDSLTTREDAECNLDFLGLVGIYDPPRLETAPAVKACQDAGIFVHMLTGDHVRTAAFIAREVGILPPHVRVENSGSQIMTAAEFDRLSDDEIDRLNPLPLVVARCSPTTKVRMVDALHRRKAFCIMTGDGINDAPALGKADVGIAMGKSGSDVAKEAADMVLTDDNFASIVQAIKEGRRLYDNIQKFLLHLLISNIAQVFLLLIALAFKDSRHLSIFPLSPIEILWANLVTSSFLAIGLGLEEAQSDVMTRRPHNPDVGVFTKELIIDKFVYGSTMGGLCLLAFAMVSYVHEYGNPNPTLNLGHDCNSGWNSSCEVVYRARATTYATITFLLLVTAWEVKHFTRSLFNMNPEYKGIPGLSVFSTVWRNRFLFWAVMAGFVLCFPIVYIPFVNRVIFKHDAISWEWGVVFGCVGIYLIVVEAWKAIKRRFLSKCGVDRPQPASVVPV